MYPTRRRPSPAVTHGHLNHVFPDRRVHFHVAVRQPVGVLDDVGARLAARHQDLVGIVGLDPRVGHPAAKGMPDRR